MRSIISISERITTNLRWGLFVCVTCSVSLGYAVSKQTPLTSADSLLIPILKQHNPVLERFELLEEHELTPDLKLVLFRGHGPAKDVPDKWDETRILTGVFIVDKNSERPILTVDVQLYWGGEEWWDSDESRMESITGSTAIIHYFEYTSGYATTKIKYFFNLVEKRVLKKVRYRGPNFISGIEYHDDIYFLASIGNRTIIVKLTNPLSYQSVTQYSITDSIQGQPISEEGYLIATHDSLYLFCGDRGFLEQTRNLKKGYIYRGGSWVQICGQGTRLHCVPEDMMTLDPNTSLESYQTLGYSIRKKGIAIYQGGDTTFYPFPYYSYGLLKKYRPEESKIWAEIYGDFRKGAVPPDTLIVGPDCYVVSTVAGSKVWLGTSYYGGEGETGIGGIGYFDIDTKNYRMFYLPEIVWYSISAICSDQKMVLAGLVAHGEYDVYPCGLAIFDIGTEQVMIDSIPEVILSIEMYKNLYFIGTEHGLYILDGEKKTHVDFDFDVNQKYYAVIREN